MKHWAGLVVVAAATKMSHHISCPSCYADTAAEKITSTCQSCGESWRDTTLTWSYTQDSANEILDAAMKKRVMCLQVIWHAEHKIQMIAAGPLLGTRQKLYNMYMNGQLRLTKRSSELREQLEPCDYDLFDTIGKLYEEIADAQEQLTPAS